MMYCLVNRKTGRQSFVYSKRELLDWIVVHSFCLSRCSMRMFDLHRVRTIRKGRGLNYSITWKCAERICSLSDYIQNLDLSKL